MERDPDSKRRGHSTKSYIAALEQEPLPTHREGMALQQHDASIHTARKAMAWFADHEIQLLKWPPYSSDLNPIVGWSRTDVPTVSWGTGMIPGQGSHGVAATQYI